MVWRVEEIRWKTFCVAFILASPSQDQRWQNKKKGQLTSIFCVRHNRYIEEVDFLGDVSFAEERDKVGPGCVHD